MPKIDPDHPPNDHRQQNAHRAQDQARAAIANRKTRTMLSQGKSSDHATERIVLLLLSTMSGIPQERCLGVTSFRNYTDGGRQRKRNRMAERGRRRAGHFSAQSVSARRTLNPTRASRGGSASSSSPARTEGPVSRRASGPGRSTGTVGCRTASRGSSRAETLCHRWGNAWRHAFQIDSLAKPQAASSH